MKQTLAGVIQANVTRLRKERGWSQRELAVRISKAGLGPWTPNRVAQVESGRQRPDRLGDLAALCAAFAVDYLELVQSEEQVHIDGQPEPVSVSAIVLALRGHAQQSEIAFAELDEVSDWDAETHAAKALGITDSQFMYLKSSLFGSPYVSLARLRDEAAGITSELSVPSIRARRGHATRELMVRLKEAIDREGIDAIYDREHARVRELLLRSDARERQERIESWEAVRGETYDPNREWDEWVEQQEEPRNTNPEEESK